MICRGECVCGGAPAVISLGVDTAVKHSNNTHIHTLALFSLSISLHPLLSRVSLFFYLLFSFFSSNPILGSASSVRVHFFSVHNSVFPSTTPLRFIERYGRERAGMMVRKGEGKREAAW